MPSLPPAPLIIKKSKDLFKCSVSFVLKDVMYLISILFQKIHLCKLERFIHAVTVNHFVLGVKLGELEDFLTESVNDGWGTFW